MCGWYQIKTDDVFEFFNKTWIAGQFEAFDQMWLQAVGMPDTLDRGFADATNLRHFAAAPMRHFLRSRLRLYNHFCFFDAIEGLKTFAAWSIFLQRFNPTFLITFEPFNHRWARCLEVFSQGIINSPSPAPNTIHVRSACRWSVVPARISRFNSFRSSGFTANAAPLSHMRPTTPSSNHIVTLCMRR